MVVYNQHAKCGIFISLVYLRYKLITNNLRTQKHFTSPVCVCFCFRGLIFVVNGLFSDGFSFDFAHLLEQGFLNIVPQGCAENSYREYYVLEELQELITSDCQQLVYYPQLDHLLSVLPYRWFRMGAFFPHYFLVWSCQ